MTRAPRPYAMHDTRELRRHERAERLAFFLMLIPCAAVLYAVACWAGLL